MTQKRRAQAFYVLKLMSVPNELNKKKFVVSHFAN